MPRTVQGAFEELVGGLQITSDQREIARTRIRHLGEVLKAAITMEGQLKVVGSYARGTQIRQARDIDVLMPLAYANWATHENDSAAVLRRVRDAIVTPYSQSTISTAGVAVVMHMTEFDIDVVPVFHRTGGGYLMPNGQGRWKSTNPDHHVALTEAHARGNAAFRPLVQLMKYWNLRNGHLLRPFHLEMLVERIWRIGRSNGNYSRAMTYTFTALPSLIQSAFSDPWEPGGRVDTYLGAPVRIELIHRLNQDGARAVVAEQFLTGLDARNAIAQWKSIFMEGFPEYGGWF
jgi:predicted nucleotidyltransferase